MNPSPEVSAAAADDAYKNRAPNDVDDRAKLINLGGDEYTIFGYRNNLATGFHATAYREVAPPHNVIIAYRGTDPDIKNHALTTAQDIFVDATMVRDRVNPQEADARAFTQAMVDKAVRYGINKDQITVAGHSLGGTLAEIESWRFGLGGATFNAYGAVGLGYGISEGGPKLTDYMMAGDGVSAASPHYGKVVPLASNQDVLALKAGHYMDAMPGQARNPFLAMLLSDHSNTHFSPAPGSHETSVLEPGMIAQYAQNYVDHKAAFDMFRADVRRERGELAMALRAARHNHGEVVLPADVQRQLDEYLAVNADPAIRQAVEGNSLVHGAEHSLQQGAGMVEAGGAFVQRQDEHTATLAREAGAQMAVVNPAAPLVGVAMGEAAHWHGQAVHAASRQFAEGVRAIETVVRQDAHAVTRMAEAAVHSPALQDKVTGSINHLVDAYRGVESAARTVEGTYEGVHRAVSNGIDAAEQAAHDAYAAIGSFGRHGDPPTRADASRGPRDFSDPGHPQHAMYASLQKLLPSGTSRERLHQATAACHEGGMNAPADLEGIYGGKSALVFMPRTLLGYATSMDLSRPAPTVQQTLQQVQQYDQQHARMQAQMNTQLVGAQVQQGPMR